MQANSNLYTFFEAQFPVDKNQPFLVDHQGTVIRYGELERQTAKLADYLLQCGLSKGERIAVQVQKSPQALMVYLAALRAGLIYLPLNTGYTAAELNYFLNDADPALIICDPNSQSIFETLVKNNHLQASIETLTEQGSGTLMANAQNGNPDFDTVLCAPDDLAAILYTSGTTGQPKGAALSHHNLASNAQTLAECWGWQSDDVLLHALPLFHVHGLFVACHCVLAVGASMIFLPRFDSGDVIKHLPKATVMMGVPTFYTRLLATPAFTAEACVTMRLFISGSAPLLEQTHQDFSDRTGHNILERYGMTETGMLASNPLHGERRPGSVGLALPEVTIRLSGTNPIGTLEVKGPNVFQGYWQMPEKTREAFTDDGFFITGDQATLSKDGYITIVGRQSDMIISGGYNVYPKEIETVLDALAGIKESAVFARPHPDFGEAVNAAVVCDNTASITEQSIIQHARTVLAAYKVPKRILILEELPRNAMGKVQKKLLRELVLEEGGAV